MILVTAATPWEAVPLTRALKFHPGIKILETGVGSRRVDSILATLGKEFKEPGILVSSGLAGGLQNNVLPGDLVADLRGVPLPFLERARAAAASVGVEIHMGKILSSDRVLTEAAEKAELGRRERGVAVDMESEALRNWAHREGWTFLGIRAIFDGVGDRLPKDVPESDSIAHSLKYAMSHWTELPLLLRLGINQKRAMGMLSRFLVEYLPRLIEKRNEQPA